MKIKILIIFFLLFITNVKGQYTTNKIKDDLQERYDQVLKENNIKKIKMVFHNAEYIDKPDKNIYYYNINENGQLKKKYNNDHIIENEYDSKGKLIVKKELETIIDYIASYKYNNKDQLIEIFYRDTDSNEFIRRITFDYNSKGKLKLRNIYISEDTLWRRHTFNYNKENQIIQEEEYYPLGKRSNYYTFSYDENGNLIEVEKNEELLMKYLYNESGFIIKEETHERGNILTIETVYDENGLIHEIKQYDKIAGTVYIRQYTYTSYKGD